MDRKEKIRNTAVYVVLRFLIILTIVLSVLEGNFSNVLPAGIAIILFTVPNFLENKFEIDLPGTLESIIYIFIFSSQILGEIRNFYDLIPIWDTMLHTLNGFIFAGIGFSLCDFLNKNEKTKLYLSPIYIAFVAVLFSVTVGTLWEIFEYGVDVYLSKDMQKDVVINDIYTVHFNDENKVESINGIVKTDIYLNNGEIIEINNGYIDIGLHDTMKDMIVNFIGAVVFAVFGYFYELGVDNYEFAKNFIPKKRRSN